MKTILFVGDSITDVGRNRDNFYDLGKGYPNLVAGRLGLDAPGEYCFLNRGSSGDRIVDIYARIKRDILNLKPDIITILIGVNDVWHELDFQNGVATEKYKRIYRLLLDEIREELPETKLILMEPFVLKGTATEAHIEWFSHEVGAKAKIVQELAEEFGLPFLPLQKDLDDLAEMQPEAYWLADGVHPTVCFHQYIADKIIPILHKM